MHPSTPTVLSKELTALCAEIAPGEKPVPVAPQPPDIPNPPRPNALPLDGEDV